MKERRRVAVVGGGAIGLTSALALARRGFDATVLEARESAGSTPRADVIQPATLALFEQLGIVEDVLAIGLRASRFQFRDLREGVIAEFDLSSLADVTAYPFRLYCAQDQLTRLLFEHATAAGIRVEYGARVAGVAADDAGVRVQIKRAAQAEERAFDYLVAADGSSSTVREAAGIAFGEEAKQTRMVQVMTTYDFSRAQPDLAPHAYFMDPLAPCLITKIPGSWRALLAVPEGVTDRDLERDGWHRRVLARIFALQEPISVFHETMYAVRPGLAERFRAGRVFLAGDAAHVVLPFIAMGLNCGVHDACSLARALHEHEAFGRDSLDRWAAARRDAAYRLALTDGERLFQMLCAGGEKRTLRDAHLRGIAADAAAARPYLLRSAMLDDEASPATETASRSPI